MENEMKVVCTCAIIAIASILGLLINRIKEGKGIGLRAIQFAIITVVFPLLVILTIMKILPPATIAVVSGTIIGYAFAKSS